MTVSMLTPDSVRSPQQARDRRLAQRARLSAPTVTVTIGGKLVDSIGSDVSLGGMRLMSGRNVAVGADVSLVFFLDGDIVSARGVVRWCTPTKHDLFAFGVSFSAIEEDGPSLVSQYCRVS